MNLLPDFLSQNLPFLLIWSVGALVIGLRKTFSPADVKPSLAAARAYFWMLPFGLLIPKITGLGDNLTVMPVFVADEWVFSSSPLSPSHFAGWNLFDIVSSVWISVTVLLILRDAVLLMNWIKTLQSNAERVAWPASFDGRTDDVDLYVLRSVQFPACTFSGFRNNVFVPQALLNHPERAGMVLRHELSHVANHDFFHALLEQFWKRLWWFFPPVALLARQLALLRELRCDLESVPPNDSVSYASLLLDQAQLGLRSSMSPALSTSAKNLKTRIQMIRSVHHPVFKSGKSALLLPLFFAVVAFACDQTVQLSPAEATSGGKSKSTVSDAVFTEVDTPPAIKGGMSSLAEKIVYPEEAKKAGIEGRVMVAFVVSEDGLPEQIEVLKTVKLDENKTPFNDERLEKAAMDAVSKLTFDPGLLAGKPVKTRFAVPIVFRLTRSVSSMLYAPRMRDGDNC